jgi:signal transduction histidine kinase
VAADVDRRKIERELHEGVQQHLVALAVNLQLLAQLAEADPPAAKALLEEIERDVQQALDETTQLAQRIYPPLAARGLAAALRSAAADAGIRASVEVAAESTYGAEVAAAVYLCWAEALEHADAGAQATVMVGDEEAAFAFDVIGDGVRLEPLRDRVEALGGLLTVRSESGRRTRICASLPLSEWR